MELHTSAVSGEEEIFLREAACTLAPGQTSNTLICPRCNGGKNRDRAFSITRLAGGVAFICHRVSCGWKGRRVYGQGCQQDERQQAKDRRYRGALNLLPDTVSQLLWERYGITFETQIHRNLRWASEVNRLYIPTPYLGGEGGGVLRSLSGQQPKVLSCAAPWSSGMGFYEAELHHPIDLPIFVVEDALSAICVAEDMRCVSLQGTYLPPARLVEIIEWAHGAEIVLALDKDATNKAAEYVNKYKYLADISMLPLEQDIKDMGGAERREMLWNYKS